MYATFLSLTKVRSIEWLWLRIICQEMNGVVDHDEPQLISTLILLKLQSKHVLKHESTRFNKSTRLHAYVKL